MSLPQNFIISANITTPRYDISLISCLGNIFLGSVAKMIFPQLDTIFLTFLYHLPNDEID